MKKAAGWAALKYVERDTIVGVGTGSTVNHFIDALATIKDDIQRSLETVDKIILIFGARQVGKTTLIQEIIKTTPQRKQNVGYADPLNPFIIDKEDNTIDDIHYDANGQRELGRRYFDQFLLLTE